MGGAAAHDSGGGSSDGGNGGGRHTSGHRARRHQPQDAHTPRTDELTVPFEPSPHSSSTQRSGSDGGDDAARAPPAGSDAPHNSPSSSTSTSTAKSRLLTLSPTYAAYLSSLGASQLCSELESQLGRRRMGCMLQCLYEVGVHRLPEPCEAQLPSTAAAGKAKEYPPLNQQRRGVAIQRNHRLLTAVLRMMTLVDVYAMEPDAEAWLRVSAPNVDNNDDGSRSSRSRPENTAAAKAVVGRAGQCAHPLSYRLAQTMLRWLSCEVSRLDAHTSLQVLHLLAQQSITWSEAVLATLVDTLDVHIARAAQHADHPFTLQHYSLLLDTMARFQAQQMNVTRLQSQLPAAAHASQTSRAQWSVPSAESTSEALSAAGENEPAAVAASAARRAAIDSEHPVSNAHVFRCVAEALTRELVAAADRTRRSSPASAGAGMQHADTATILFLTRALSRLHWWSDELMSALTAPLTRYVQRHPASYAGVVMLVGRHENGVGDAALLWVLQESLLGLLRRRGRGRRRESGAIADEDDEGGHAPVHDARSMTTGLVAVREKADLLGNSSRSADDDLGEEEEEEGDEWMRFSSRDSSELAAVEKVRCDAAAAAAAADECTALATSHNTSDTNGEREGERQQVQRQQQQQQRSQKPMSRSLSLIDLHSFPSFLESLVRFYRCTMQATSSNAVVLPAPDGAANGEHGKGNGTRITRAALQTRMIELFALLQDDLQRSIPSLEAFAATMTAPLLARLLCALITTTEQLQLAQQCDSLPADEQGGTPRASCLAPLVVELAYVWTLQVARLRPPPLPPRDGRASHTAADVALFHRVAAMHHWRRALRVHHVLVRTGALRRTRSSYDASLPTQELGAGTRVPRAEEACQPGRYFMPDDVVRRAPRVQAAMEQAKHHLQAERQRVLRQLRKEQAAMEKEGADDDDDDRDDWGGHKTEYASAFGYSQEQQRNARAAPPPRSAVARMRNTSSHPRNQATAQRRRTAALVASLQLPVRSSDVFAKYSKALSRLL
ncbi:putative mitochondrial hypothetical protein [Leptomonas pyrrhocoris]|uniref:Uncharacterized protein n=1 Tax=Leptomonas pyrrhocoris TaxID=157538 RepID=A0A0N0DQK3_LEPPY|nr:putative mitochondrial hypothetical protein [Leptomonas pyrrhocoris]KPA73418.1 putative mitochondrial hypothetical protein [Leptomonas pyrrhocoris]|eukprot:XP_015651857.1 putative mitochondrial hypothetical protein [Leptomonas pyrrhocoris]